MDKKVEFQEPVVEYEEHKGASYPQQAYSQQESEQKELPAKLQAAQQKQQRDDGGKENQETSNTMDEETYKTFLAQDQKWKGAEVDARQHLSHREAHQEYRAELTREITRYQVIEDWVMLIHCNISSVSTPNRLRCLNQDILRIIAEFSFTPGHAAVVGMLDKNLHQSYLQHGHYRRQQLLQQPQPFFIYIRKRPLLPYEVDRGGFSVVDINTYTLDSDALCNRSSKEGEVGKCNMQGGQGKGQPFSNLVGVHDGKLARNGRILEMSHKVFAVSEAFNEFASNEEVCVATVEPLVRQVMQGLPATMLFYGQTGTGKTHTLLGALKYIAARFAGSEISLTFYEIRGKKSFDLLNDRAIVHLRSDEKENVHVRGCKVARFSKMVPKEFMRVLGTALANRSSKVTERNPVSSRSHAICTITITTVSQCHTDSNKMTNNNSHTAENNANYTTSASLRLVDLAGSERNYETSTFTAADHRESAEINFALMALKDCFRAYNAACVSDQLVLTSASTASANTKSPPQRAPYRASLLTRVLRECFIRDTRHTTSVIATVSPSPTDLEHTLNSLEHVTMMDPALERLPIERCVSVDVMIDGCAQPNRPVDTWNYRELMSWLSHTDGGKFSQLVLPVNMTGKELLELNVTSLTALCAGQLRDAREGDEGSAWVEEGETTRGQQVIAKRLFALLRREQNASLLRQSKVHQTL